MPQREGESEAAEAPRAVATEAPATAAQPGKRTQIEAAYGAAPPAPAVPPLDYARLAFFFDDPSAQPQPAQPAVAPSITAAIARFKGVVNTSDATGPNAITSQGARFWANRLSNEILGVLLTLPDDADGKRFKDLGRDVAGGFAMGSEVPPELMEMRRIAMSSKSPGQPIMWKLMFTGPAAGPGLEALLWQRLNDPKNVENKVPDLTPYCSFITLQTMAKWEDDACQFHAMAVARRFKERSPKPTKAFGNVSVADGTGTRDWRPLEDNRLVLIGDLVNQPGAAGIADKLRVALDAGNVIHARVLSGIGVGMNLVRTNPNMKPGPVSIPMVGEHSIVIIGHDGANTFVFNDANASHSQDLEAGFGLLHASDGMFGTADGAGDLAVNTVDEGLGHGFHVTHPKQKRYQVLTLGTV
jgi:hypothetical protein